MEKMVQCFWDINGIIGNIGNCVHHFEPLRKLIENFNKVYSLEEGGSLKCEADALTYCLHEKLKMVYGEKLG